MNKCTLWAVALVLILAACQPSAQTPQMIPTLTASPSATIGPLASPTVTKAVTPTPLFPDYTTIPLPDDEGEQIVGFPLNGDYIRGIGWSADSRKLALGVGLGDALIWDLDTAQPQMTVILAQGGASELYWDDATGILRTVEFNEELGGATVAKYYAPSSELLMEPPTPDFVPVAWSPDGEHYLTSAWDTSELPFTLVFEYHAFGRSGKLWDRALGSATAIAWSPDGERIAFPDPAAGEIYTLATTGETIRTQPIAMTEAPCLEWSPDNAMFAVEGPESIMLLDARRGGIVREFMGRCAIAFSPDSRIIATSTTEGIISLWDVRSGNLIRELHAHHDKIKALEWSPDGTMLASSSLDGTFIVWNTSE